MYAITFDLDTKKLEELYPSPNWRKAYDDIADYLYDYGFERQQGSVYFGDKFVDAVVCVTAVQQMSNDYSWLKDCVKDIRMLRIEERNDLMPALKGLARRRKRLKIA